MKVPSNLIKDIRNYYCEQLCSIYGKDEANTLILILFEHYFKIDRVKMALEPDLRLSESEMLKIHFAVKDLLKHKPIQYIIGETEFCDLKFKVDENVLIPRPETSEMVKMIANESTRTHSRTHSRTHLRTHSMCPYNDGKDASNASISESHSRTHSMCPYDDGNDASNASISESKSAPELSILDIGTGSGCIAISLAKMFPNAEVYALDISEKALAVTKKNAEINNVNVTFIHDDILTLTQTLTQTFDIIVSNPPYVRELEKAEMRDNVLKWEPHNALFVSDNDPLIFYRSILEFAKTHLKEKGEVWFETNEFLAEEMTSLCNELGFSDVKIYKDFRNKDRILKLGTGTRTGTGTGTGTETH